MTRTNVLRAGIAIGVGLLLVATAGCTRVKLKDAEYTTDTDRVEAGDAQKAAATIDMGAGELLVRGGSDALMEGTYEFTKPSWRPEVDYAVTDGEGYLSVRTPRQLDFGITGNVRYQWDIAFGDSVPLVLKVRMGAGKADLDLRGTQLTDLNVNLGAGDTTIDLSGDWDHDVTADITAGAGTLTLRVPANVGVRLVGYQDGLGSYRADGFKQDGEALVNDAYENADVRFDVALRRGLGDVTVETVQ